MAVKWMYVYLCILSVSITDRAPNSVLGEPISTEPKLTASDRNNEVHHNNLSNVHFEISDMYSLKDSENQSKLKATIPETLEGRKSLKEPVYLVPEFEHRKKQNSVNTERLEEFKYTQKDFINSSPGAEKEQVPGVMSMKSSEKSEYLHVPSDQNVISENMKRGPLSVENSKEQSLNLQDSGDRNSRAGTLKRVKKDTSVPHEFLYNAFGKMAYQSVETHVDGCHFAFVTANGRHPFVSQIIRLSALSLQPIAIVDIKRQNQSETDYFHIALWGVDATVCRVLLVDLITSDGHQLMFDFLTSQKTYVWPETWTVVVGSDKMAKSTLLHRVFRNTLQPVYLGIGASTLESLTSHLSQQKDTREVMVYCRCLYCNAGNPIVKRLFTWPVGSDLRQSLVAYPDQHIDTLGHLYRVVAMASFPYNEYTLDSDDVAPTVTLKDCMDRRMLLTVSAHMNFTYEIRAPWDMQWGVSTDTGNYTGMVGTIQYDKADFTTTLAPTPERNVIVNTARAYNSDVLTVVALKPELLPQYLVIIRPFTVDVWIYLILIVMVWGFFLWLLQKGWSSYSGERPMTFSRAIFYSWAVILEDPPLKPPKNTVARILIGFWLISCLVATTGFRSSLVAHLGVQGKTKPIDSFRDLVERGDFGWGMEEKYLTGVSLIYFRTTTDPVVMKVYKYIEYLEDYKVAFRKIIQGKYGMITFQKMGYLLVNSYYTDSRGNTPYYIGKEGYRIVPYFGWGYGKGAPFGDRFNAIMGRLNDAGITDHWIQELMDLGVKQKRREFAGQMGNDQDSHVIRVTTDDTVKLRVIHLIGVFLALFFGFGVSFITLLIERLIANTSDK